jgi:putative tryptophan/tyrosine transport system substrate-binding protein
MSELTAKRLALLHELVPHAPSIAVLENPKGPSHILLHDAQEVAAPLGVQVTIVAATTKNELDEALTDISPRRFDAFMIMPAPFFERTSTRTCCVLSTQCASHIRVA